MSTYRPITPALSQSPLGFDSLSISESDVLSNSVVRPPGRKPKTRTDRIPRAPNAFICFRSFYNSITLRDRNQNGNDQCSVSRAAGDAWRRLPEKEKNGWYAIASKVRSEHAKVYPGYQYKPIRIKRNRSNEQGTNDIPSRPRSKEIDRLMQKRRDGAGTGDLMNVMYGRRGQGGSYALKRVPESVRRGDPRRWTQCCLPPINQIGTFDRSSLMVRQLPSFWEGFGRFLCDDNNDDTSFGLRERSSPLIQFKTTENGVDDFEETEYSCESEG